MLLLIGFQETFFILLIAILLFGPKKIPELARVLGQGIRALRNATDQIKQEVWEASEKADSELEDSTKELKDQLKDIKNKSEDTFLDGSIRRKDD